MLRVMLNYNYVFAEVDNRTVNGVEFDRDSANIIKIRFQADL
jgi:hypothetical protein